MGRRRSFLPSCTAVNSIGVPLKNRNSDPVRVLNARRLFAAIELPKDKSLPRDFSFDRYCIHSRNPLRRGGDVLVTNPRTANHNFRSTNFSQIFRRLYAQHHLSAQHGSRVPSRVDRLFATTVSTAAANNSLLDPYSQT